MAAATIELNSYLMPFHPYRDGKNPKHTSGSDSQTLVYLKMENCRDSERKKKFYTKVCDWLKKEMEDMDMPVTVVIAPGHKACADPSGFMHDIVGKLLDDNRSITDGRKQLIRIKTVSKQSITPGSRSEDTHKGTIEINGSVNNKGKVVIILDDVWTSGSTLRVCKKVMLTTKPKEVKLFAIGKTV